MKKKILIFGHTGNLGSNFIFFLRKNYEFILNVNETKNYIPKAEYIKFNKNDFLDKYVITKNKIKKISPDIILNAAAITDLELCEKKPDNTTYANVTLPTILSKICKELNTKFVHISTDHLYKSLKKFKTEKYLTSKINVYGEQKLKAEKNIKKNNNNALIIRTNFFSHSSNSKQLLYKIKDTLQNNKKLNLFDDYFFTPIYSKYLSKIIKVLINKNEKGIFNVVSSERISKYEFAKLIVKEKNLIKKLFVKKKIKSANFYAKRCTDLSLSNQKLKKKINLKIPSIKKQLDEFLKNDKKIVDQLSSKFPYGRHSINSNDISAVKKVLLSGSLTQGSFIDNLENKINEYLGVKYSIAVSSATAGLHLCYQAINISNSKQIITTPNTFVSTSNAALFCNSRPIFTDISSNSLGMCPDILEENLKNKNNVHAIVPVLFGGLAMNSKKIYKLAKERGLKIVEDAAHAFGAKYECGSKVGSCKYSDLTVFSFHPVKILAGGEGGVITTNDKKLYNILVSLRSHGIRKDNIIKNFNVGLSKNRKNLWYYEMSRLGYHYRQTDIHSGLIASQLERVDKFLHKRGKLAKIYDKEFFNKKNIKLVQNNYRNMSSNHLYILKIDFNNISQNRNDFMTNLRKANIITQVHYIPVPMQLYYKRLGYNMKNLNNTKDYYNQCLSIPLYYDLNFEEQKYIINTIDGLLLSS